MNQKNKNNILKKIIFSNESIQSRVGDIARDITNDYEGKDILLVTILRGGIFFLTDLARNIDLKLSIDFMGISTYGINDSSSGVVRITKDLEENIEGKDVIIVEDIIDTGLTISYLLRNLNARNPNSIELCTLLDRETRRIADINIKYSGFKIGEKFIVGYGLDYKQKYRNLKDIYEINLEAIQEDIEVMKNVSSK